MVHSKKDENLHEDQRTNYKLSEKSESIRKVMQDDYHFKNILPPTYKKCR
jgi:hypothetical protein